MKINNRHWQTMTQQNKFGHLPVFARVDLHFYSMIINIVLVLVFDSVPHYIAQAGLELASSCPCLPKVCAPVGISFFYKLSEQKQL